VGSFGSPELIPPPESRYEVHYCKHCQCDSYGNYCSICGRALSKKAKWKLFRALLLGCIAGAITYFLIIASAYSSTHR